VEAAVDDHESTLELDVVESPAVPDPEPTPAPTSEEGVFTHAEVIPLVRPPEIGADEATAGLDPDLLASADERDDESPPGRGESEATVGGVEASAEVDLPEDDDTPPDRSDGDESDFAAFSLEDYTGTATSEYAELARAVAASDDEALEQAAISAEMPGLDATLVGLDDVVDAGIGVTETISTTRRSDLGLRVATALGLLVVFFGSLLWPWAIGGLILVVLGVASLELYIVTVNAGYRPLTWAGLVGVIGALAGTWVWGVVAIPIALALTAIGATLFLALSAERRTPLLDLALTVSMMAWIGVLGAPAFEIVEAPEFRWLILAVVLTTAFMDVAQYFVGRALGRRKLSPVVSPKKTIEGLVGGIFTALVVGVVFGSIEASPFDPGSGLAFGAMVAIVAPFGDLAVSVVKRALAVKDMSAILPGHGGIMDRIDAMVFVIPAAWIHFQYFDLLG
jgi:phosphatidate cytidylyltransferase